MTYVDTEENLIVTITLIKIYNQNVHGYNTSWNQKEFSGLTIVDVK